MHNDKYPMESVRLVSNRKHSDVKHDAWKHGSGRDTVECVALDF